MLQRGDRAMQTTSPTEMPPPAVGEVDWNAWWVAIDKRIGEHLVNERELMLDSVAEAFAMFRREIRDDMPELRGPPGRPGQDAKLPRVKIWREDTVFYEGECVAFGGSLYQAQCDTGKSPLFAKHWLCLATAGADGKAIRHRGTFDPEIEYREHDAVLVDGCSFLVLANGFSICMV